MLTRANRGMVINKKSSYCKDCANQGRVNQGIAVCNCKKFVEICNQEMVFLCYNYFLLI